MQQIDELQMKCVHLSAAELLPTSTKTKRTNVLYAARTHKHLSLGISNRTRDQARRPIIIQVHIGSAAGFIIELFRCHASVCNAVQQNIY